MNSNRNKLLLTLSSLLIFVDGQSLIVTTENGPIQGSNMQSRLNQQFFAFRGIPYAQAPTGSLRFEAPVPVESWNSVLDATKDGPICPQPTSSSAEQSEDCLQLNVYTPKLPTSGETTQLKPVIAYIHGGGFFAGSGISAEFAGPQYLMDRDIVLVTMNYRLGTLGFLATGTKEAPGNAGFKDQVLALKWIQNNIAKFGGNPELVTIAGQSAGGRCVSLHMVSDMSKGLFHRAIALSGAITPQWKIGLDQLDLARKQARLVKCPDDNIDAMVNCLKQVKREDFVNTVDDFKDAGGNPIIVWKPVVEQDFGQERFLTDTPINLFKSGNFSTVPVMTGIVRDEFSSLAKNVLKENDLLKNIKDNYDEIAPDLFLYDRDGERSEKIGRELLKAYLPFDEIDDRAFGSLNMLFSDAVTGFTVHRFAHVIANYTKVFYYKNIFVGRFSEFYYPKENIPFGTHHADDLMYILYLSNKTPLFTQSDPENIAVERATRMWENFALSGNPNNPDDVWLKDMEWSEFDLEKENYLEIGTHLVEKSGLFLERYKVWEMLFPLDSSASITLTGNIMFVLIIIAIHVFTLVI